MDYVVNNEISNFDYTILADYVSKFLGYASIGCWLCAQLPQILENQRLRSADGLSLYLLYFWLAGDMGNMYSCVLNHQLPFQVYEAVYFVCTDLILLFQYFCFRHNKLGGCPMSSSEEDDKQTSTTVTIAEEYGCVSSRPMSINESSRAASPIFMCVDRPLERIVTNEDGKFLLYGQHTYYGTVTENNDKSKKKQLKTTALMGLFFFGFKSVFLPSATTTTATTTAQQVISSSTTNLTLQSLIDNEMITLGWLLAWICSGFYILSRIPQIHKNHKRHSTEGLSIALFTFSVCGNLTYAASILVHPGHTYKTFMESLPYIVGCFGSLALDVIIFGQFVSYRNSSDKEIAKV